jgi:hypothetical protein
MRTASDSQVASGLYYNKLDILRIEVYSVKYENIIFGKLAEKQGRKAKGPKDKCLWQPVAGNNGIFASVLR